jgi:hypothetical protein
MRFYLLAVHALGASAETWYAYKEHWEQACARRGGGGCFMVAVEDTFLKRQVRRPRGAHNASMRA